MDHSNYTKLTAAIHHSEIVPYANVPQIVPFDQSMYPKGNVEFWLGDVEDRMRSSIHASIEKSLPDFWETERGEWITKWPARTVLAVESVWWTQGVEKAIEERSLPAFCEQSLKNLNILTAMVRGKLSKLARKTIGALIVIDVHARDVTQNLVDVQVGDDSRHT